MKVKPLYLTIAAIGALGAYLAFKKASDLIPVPGKNEPFFTSDGKDNVFSFKEFFT